MFLLEIKKVFIRIFMKPPRPLWLVHPHTPDKMGLDHIVITYGPQVERRIIKRSIIKAIKLNIILIIYTKVLLKMITQA